MNKTSNLALLPTTITGSLPRPTWYTENIGARPFRDAIGDARFREQYTDAVGTFIRDQERAGLDIVTDGDARFDTDVGGLSWVQYPARRLGGMSGGDYLKKGYGGTRKGEIIFEVMESRVIPRAVDKIGRGPLHYTSLWKVAQGMTTRPIKFGTVTPEVIGMSIGNDFYAKRQELLEDLSDAFREELTDLALAGCSIIQLEEPNIHLVGVQRGGGAPELDARYFADLFNRTVRGLREVTEVWCHTCWGNPAQQRLFATTPSYRDSLELLNTLDVDVLTFETCATGGQDLELIGTAITDKKMAIGVVDHRNLQVESPDEVAALIRKALRHIPVERLILTSDCGFGREGMSRRIAFYKMVAIVRGANLVRRELGLPESLCLAADPRFALVEQS